MKNIFAPKGNKQPKIKSKIARAKTLYSSAIVAIVLVALILLNVVFTVAGERLHLEVDLTADKAFSMSQGNIDYIKEVDKEVTITFLATEDDYTGQYFKEYAAYYYQAEDSTGLYFPQTVEIVKKYAGYNDKIKVDFVDVQENEFTTIRQEYPNESFSYGDILVECSFIGSDGKSIKRHKVLNFSQIYTLEDKSGYAAYGYSNYTIGGNNIETYLSSAVYYVTSKETAKAAYFDSHCEESLLEAAYIPALELNNYEITKISDAIITESSIPEDTDVLIMACVTSDFTAGELEVIEDFLHNDNKKGKGLVFFASTSSPKLPNLYGFLEEWGISIEDGILYETTESYTNEQATNMLVMNSGNDITAEVNSKEGIYLADNMVAMEIAFERYEDRIVSTFMQTSPTVVIAPSGIDVSSWKPDSSYAEAPRSVGIITSDTSYEENTGEGTSSYVAAFASTDFVYSNYIDYESVLNLDMSLCAANIASGNNTNEITFTTKSISEESFADKVTTASANAMLIVFVVILPVAILAACVVVYIRRKSR